MDCISWGNEILGAYPELDHETLVALLDYVEEQKGRNFYQIACGIWDDSENDITEALENASEEDRPLYERMIVLLEKDLAF